ncbi:DUF550 domain-containing protein [Burkholderia dolosa]|nr:DUF550 domain-containing protein [Burkholderia dolosa]
MCCPITHTRDASFAPPPADERAARLDDADIDTIAESMPGGLDSFIKQWGWRQFARAIEDEVIINVARAASATESADERAAFDILAHLQRQREFSERTFGPGARTAGICDHIRKELKEIEANPSDLTEWIDVVILALDGAWRAGGSPQQIIDAIVAKQTKNEGRTWPDWRTVPADKAIEHDRSQDSCPQCHGKGAVVFRDPEEAFDVTCGVCNGSGQARAASANETVAEGAKPIGFRTRVPGFAWVPWLTDDQETIQRAIADALAHGHEGEAIYGAPVPAMAAEAVAIPDGWRLVRVNEHFDALIAALDRAESKGYLPDSIREEWENFACDENAPQPAQADARDGLTDEQRDVLGGNFGALEQAENLCRATGNDSSAEGLKALSHALNAFLKGADHAE